MNPLDAARECIKEALTPYFKGKTSEDRLEDATANVLVSISHLITARDDVKKKPLGATVMTEQASGTIRPGIAPRTI